MTRRLTNAAYTLATTDQLWEGMDALTSEEWYERETVEWEYRLEKHISDNYGDCGQSLRYPEDYAQMVAEEAREHFYGIPNTLLY